ncbi:MAG: TetR family transcriptional regulator [Nitriliruptorales bacterium]|nr:TetR family transcriptional regulator [Nitriliruptorales bacterium]
MMRRDTATRVLDAAEFLFAEHGFEGASVRDITERARAGVAAVNYHFGSKEGLLRAVLDRTVVPITRRRSELLDEALARSDGEPLELRTLLEAFVLPDLLAIRELHARGPHAAKLVARLYAAPPPIVAHFMEEQFAEDGARWARELTRALPELPPDAVWFRLRRCLVGVVVYLFGTSSDLPVATDEEVEVTLRQLVAFLEGGMRAPAPIDATTGTASPTGGVRP